MFNMFAGFSYNPNFRDDALSDIVESNGKHFYVDSCNTPDHGYETMVFACDANGNVTDWMDLYAEWYDTASAMKDGHKVIVEKIKNGTLEWNEQED